MRPKASYTQKQETTRRKNHAHWSRHKEEISTKRVNNRTNLKRLQKSNIGSHELTNLSINDAFSYMSIEEKLNNDYGEEMDSFVSDTDFEDEYFAADDEEVIRNDEDQSEDIIEEEIEANLNEEQVKIANEFFNVDESTIPIHEYNELVSNRFLSYIPYFFTDYSFHL